MGEGGGMVRRVQISCARSDMSLFTCLPLKTLGCLALQEGELRLAIQDIGENLASVCAALAADPEEAELLEVRRCGRPGQARLSLPALWRGQRELTLCQGAGALSAMGLCVALPRLQVRAQLEEALHASQAALQALAGAAAGDAGDAGDPQPEAGRTTPGEAAEAAADTAAAAAAAADAAAAPAPAPGGRPRAAEPGGRSNAGIHPRSRYAHQEPDFAALAAARPALAQYLVPPRGPGGRPGLDFTRPAACRELTAALLAADFGIDWWVPLGQLVPPVTNRANYLHWLEDLLDLSPPPGGGAGAAGAGEAAAGPGGPALPLRMQRCLRDPGHCSSCSTHCCVGGRQAAGTSC